MKTILVSILNLLGGCNYKIHMTTRFKKFKKWLSTVDDIISVFRYYGKHDDGQNLSQYET